MTKALRPWGIIAIVAGIFVLVVVLALRSPAPTLEQVRIEHDMTADAVPLIPPAHGTVADAAAAVSTPRPKVDRPTYTEFLAAVRSGKVSSVTITGSSIAGEYDDGERFSLVGPEFNLDLPRLLDESGVTVTYLEPADRVNWNRAALPLFILGALGVWAFTRNRSLANQGGGAATAARGNASIGVTVIEPGKLKARFADVAGLDEAKADLAEIVDFLKHPERYKAMGAKIPKGVLLYGPPGTGKTLLARAVAGEAGVHFIHFSASQFVEVYVGVGAARVRSLFDLARKHAPCIIFIDELDAVGRHRSSGVTGNDEREQTLNQLLVEMDGFESSEGIIVLAATNRRDILDQALQRPGRFDRQIAVDPPDLEGRRAILSVHAKGKTFDPSVSLDVIARQTPGFTGADLANVLNEGAILAVRSRQSAIGMAQIEEAIDRVLAGGPAKHGRLITPAEKRRVAVHEAGHALAARLQPNPDPVHRVTVIPRGGAGGYTLTLPSEEKQLYTKSDLDKHIVMLLAGRAAEELLLGEVSSGATNDLERAYNVAREMVGRFGMGALGPIALSQSAGSRAYSEELIARIDNEAREIVIEAAQKAAGLLQQHRDALERVTDALMEKETLTGEELDALLGLSTIH